MSKIFKTNIVIVNNALFSRTVFTLPMVTSGVVYDECEVFALLVETIIMIDYSLGIFVRQAP